MHLTHHEHHVNMSKKKKREDVFFLTAVQNFLAQTLRERPFQVMFAGTRHTEEQKELNTRQPKSPDASKITSAFADSGIQFLWSVMSILERMLCLCFALMYFLISVALPFF